MITLLHTFGTRINDGFMRLLEWREKHIKEKTFVIILALMVGLFA